MKILFDYNRTLFNPETDTLYVGVIELLESLHLQNELYLMSRNEPGRENRLRELGIGKFFSQIVFVEDKSLALFVDLVGDTRDVIVVGDCVFDEIRIGNQLGYTTVLVRQGRFADVSPQNLQEKPDYTVDSIPALSILLSMYV